MTSELRLPSFLTPFIGRQLETAQLLDLVRAESLVTVVGTGGAGKTRLARQVGSIVADEGIGVHWVELAELSVEEVEPAIRMSFGISPASKYSLAESVDRFLDGKPAMLICDNAEHVGNVLAPLIVSFGEAAMNLSILITSRKPLGVADECEWDLPSMSLPTINDSLPPCSGLDVGVGSIEDCGDAIMLFGDRARRAFPEFLPAATQGSLGVESLEEAMAEREVTIGAVVSICQGLDGIPLAIELAAARCRVLTPPQILHGLNDALGLLSGGSKGATDRQRTIEGCIQWSYDLLDESCQRLLERLSVFRGGWTTQTATSVFDDVPVLNDLDELVQHSLVYVDSRGPGPGGVPELRFSMLETVRQFAAVRLAENEGAEEGANQRYSHWYSAWALGLERTLFAENQSDWLPVLNRERPNLMQAALKLAERREAHRVCDIIRGVQGFALLDDWVATIDRLLGLVTPFDDALDLDDRALIQWMKTMLLFSQGDISGVIDGCDILANHPDYSDHPEFSRRGQGVMLMMFGASGLDIIDEMLELAHSEPESDHPYWGSFTYVGVEGIAIHQGQLNKARSVSPILDERMADLGYKPLTMMRSLYLGRLAFVEGDMEEALALLYRAIDSPATALASRLMAIGYAGLVGAEVDQASELAERYPRDWESLYRRIHHAVEVEGSLLGSGYALWLRVGELISNGEHEAAVEVMAEASRITAELGAAPVVFHEQYTLVAAGLIDPEDPDWLWTGSTYAAAAKERALAERSFQAGTLGAALDHVAEALRIELPQKADRGPCFTLECMARVLMAEDRPVDGLRILGACDAFRAARSQSLVPCLADLRRSALEEVGATVGAAEVEAGLAEGARMSISEAAEFALRHRNRRGRPLTGWEALTPTEARVATHVASGMSNREVGVELLMSPETVKTHLSRVFAKVGVSNRKELIVASIRESDS